MATPPPLSADGCAGRCRRFTEIYLGWVGEAATLTGALQKWPLEWLSKEFRLRQGNLLAELGVVEMRLDVIMGNLADVEEMANAGADFDRAEAKRLIDVAVTHSEIAGPAIDSIADAEAVLQRDIEAWIRSRRPNLTAKICFCHSVAIFSGANDIVERVKDDRHVARDELEELALNLEVSIKMLQRYLRNDVIEHRHELTRLLRRLIILRLWGSEHVPPKTIPATTWDDVKPNPDLVKEYALQHVLVSGGKNLTVTEE
jgi:hypothetical protein